LTASAASTGNATGRDRNGRVTMIEVKWGVHPAGDKRSDWTTDDRRTTLVLLVQGHFRVDLTEGSVTLARQGDYAVWGPGIDHSWEVISDSVVLTIRWPSHPV
jgi:quercetin dioxygenase-like cupin family protein